MKYDCSKLRIIQYEPVGKMIPPYCFDWWFTHQTTGYYGPNPDEIVIQFHHFDNDTKSIFCPFVYKHYKIIFTR